jgi:pyruvate/2-oxoacid:ferredoxin oxidoreductase beta subunit
VGKDLPKKDIVAIMGAHGVPYAATVSLAHAEDTLRKLRLAMDMGGFRFLHVLSPLEKYFAGQGRFRKGDVDLTAVRAGIDRTWLRLRALTRS